MKQQIGKIQCVVTQHPLDTGEGLAFYVNPEGVLCFAHKEPKQTKGLASNKKKKPAVWVTLDYKTIRQFLENAAEFLKESAPFIQPDDLLQRILEALKQRSLSGLGMMRKAGLVLTGYAKIESFSRSEKGFHKILGIVFATEGSLRECQNLLNAFPEGAYCVNVFSSEEMSRALGNESTVYASFIRHKLSYSFLESSRHFASFLREMSRNSQKSMIQSDQSSVRDF
jgi:hypothetical protein